jgi:AraC family transcriptional regulator
VFSISVFDAGYFSVFSPLTEFDKWAAVLVSDHAPVPTGMEILTIPAGLYAVFIYKGPASAGAAFFQYIYGRWIPGSEYELDNRPHFEVLGDKYKNEHPDSEEEVWIPVRIKA